MQYIAFGKQAPQLDIRASTESKQNEKMLSKIDEANDWYVKNPPPEKEEVEET